ncbi:unnamed protein product [Didymodactylos carnosus]|uniref:Caseinolytic peptidase B protein homolog n=2 Tax=Didymodactylos carnosus TaxID=1234261 RepID=A0A814CXQ4_9BILA|nr:unnamed protein product [Didymodactylos carnosus]CAF3725245.1 unnamed protein product [Didymodactylos carnosus]
MFRLFENSGTFGLVTKNVWLYGKRRVAEMSISTRPNYSYIFHSIRLLLSRSTLFKTLANRSSIRRRLLLTGMLYTSIPLTFTAFKYIITNNTPVLPDWSKRLFILHAKAADLTTSERQLFEAAHHGKLDTLKRLIEQENVNVNSRHPLGWRVLHVAVINNNIECVRYLLQKGADPNVCDEYTNVSQMAKQLQWHPVHVHSAREGEFCDRLSSRATFKGFTPLHYAVLIDNIEIIQLLIEYNGDPLLENEQGHLPSAYALTNRKDLLIQYENNAKKMHEQRIRDERRRRPLEVRIKENIVGQNYAISSVCAAIRRKESGWTSDESPLVFLFLGSSGVGKTELAKQVARYLNGDKKQNRCFIRIDMSEYQEKHEVSKLIGAPPGYIGYTEGGQLTDALQKCPSAIVLFDEVDKAHPDVLTVMLQLFDEGRLTDGKGKTIDGKNAIYVMTSNLASEEIAKYAQELRNEEDIRIKSSNLTNENGEPDNQKITVSRQFKDKVVKPILKRHFRRDEFLGRINEMVYFLPFSRAEIVKLLTKELEFWQKRAKDNHGIQLSWDRKALDCLADGYDINYGARSLKHEVERSVVNQLAAAHEQGLIESGYQILLTAQENVFQSNDSASGSSVKLQRIESKGNGFFGKNPQSVTYTDIRPEDHLKTYAY